MSVMPQPYLKALGFDQPYFWNSYPSEKFHKVCDALKQQDPSLELDLVGLVEYTCKTHLLNNRTLVKGLSKESYFSQSEEYAPLPEHGKRKMPPKDVASILKNNLYKEILSYVANRHNVGILLSGGLDSRIVAGVLRELEINKDFSGRVVCLTWGIPGCRDVVYAREIAQKFGWDFVHFGLNPGVLKENIYIAADLGAEISPIHLHAMPQIADTESLDLILAGSYGDSVGRAEFSGAKLPNLPPFLPGTLDRFGLIKEGIVASVNHEVLEDAYGYRKFVLRDEEYQYREIEQEMHYMRRKLHPCMGVISEKIPVHQVFSSPETFGFMWSLDPTLRNDAVYGELLALLPGDLVSIPWARTGKTFLHEAATEADGYSKNHHNYASWLREDLKETILSLVKADTLSLLGVFSKNMDFFLRRWETLKQEPLNRMDEHVAWLASFAIFLEKFNIKSSSSLSVKEPLFSNFKKLTIWAYPFYINDSFLLRIRRKMQG